MIVECEHLKPENLKQEDQATLGGLDWRLQSRFEAVLVCPGLIVRVGTPQKGAEARRGSFWFTFKTKGANLKKDEPVEWGTPQNRENRRVQLKTCFKVSTEAQVTGKPRKERNSPEEGPKKENYPRQLFQSLGRQREKIGILPVSLFTRPKKAIKTDTPRWEKALEFPSKTTRIGHTQVNRG